MSIKRRDFEQKVRAMAVQRDIPVPESQRAQIELYKIWLENHSQPDDSDDEAERDECKMIDDLISESDRESDDESEHLSIISGDEQSEDEEERASKVEKRDMEIESYKSKIKKLRAELSATKRELKTTQMQHCKAARERHVYRQLQSGHEQTMKDFNEILNQKNHKLVALSDQNISLKAALVAMKRELTRFKYQFEDARSIFQKMNALTPGGRRKDPLRIEDPPDSVADVVSTAASAYTLLTNPCSCCKTKDTVLTPGHHETDVAEYTDHSRCSSVAPQVPTQWSQSTVSTHSLSQRSESSFASQGSCGGDTDIIFPRNPNRNFLGNGAEDSANDSVNGSVNDFEIDSLYQDRDRDLDQDQELNHSARRDREGGTTITPITPLSINQGHDAMDNQSVVSSVNSTRSSYSGISCETARSFADDESESDDGQDTRSKQRPLKRRRVDCPEQDTVMECDSFSAASSESEKDS